MITDSTDERLAIRSLRDKFAEDLRAGKLCNALSLVVTEGCNFKCNHCLPKQVADLFPTEQRQPQNMSFEEAKSAIDDFVDLVCDREDTPQIFFGGREPLVNWKTIAPAMEYASVRFEALKKAVTFIMFTNGSLLTEEIVMMLKSIEFNCRISYGVQDANDRRRPGPAGKSSFELTLQGWNLLRDAGLLDKCFTCTSWW